MIIITKLNGMQTYIDINKIESFSFSDGNLDIRTDSGAEWSVRSPVDDYAKSITFDMFANYKLLNFTMQDVIET